MQIPDEHIIAVAIDNAIHYLCEHQLANGEFVSYFAPDEPMQEWCVPDSITFFTGLIGNCLLPFKDTPTVAAALDKAANFLQYQKLRGGVWQYFTQWHRFFKYLSPDTDSTAIISYFLKQRGVPVENKAMLLGNRNRQGLFYTWFTLHPGFLRFSKVYWRLIMRELKSPVRTLLFWIKGNHKRNDVDVVVNSNALYYLGYSEATLPVVEYIVRTLSNNEEQGSDKWYPNKIVYYYFLSRLYHLPALPQLESIQQNLTQKIIDCVTNRSTALADMEMALALSSLLNVSCYSQPALLHTLAASLLAKQQQGHWQRYFMCIGSSAPTLGWGSEELTTAFCVEALAAYTIAKQKIAGVVL